MAFKRIDAPGPRPSSTELTAAMTGIGMNFAAKAAAAPNIEDTLLHAAQIGMLEGDLRVLALLVHWLEVHHPHVNADRLVRALREQQAPRIVAFWSSIGALLVKDHRFTRLRGLYSGPRVDLLGVGTEFQVSRRGEDARFVGSALRVPAGTLPRREGDVMAPRALAAQHPGYRNRVLMGPSWRADVWAALEGSPGLSVADAARVARCGFATAWQVKQDFELLRAAS